MTDMVEPADKVPEATAAAVDSDAATHDFKPQVARPRPRLRLGFVVALLLVMATAISVALLRSGRSLEAPLAPAQWDPRQHCTALEVEHVVRDPQLTDADRATCFAIAGKIDRA